MKLLELVPLLFTFSVVQTQNVNLDCTFAVLGDYTCQLRAKRVANENANIIIGGNHQPNRTNEDVMTVAMLYCDIPFIVRQLFTTFPNLRSLSMDDSGLERIQTGDFANASHLRDIIIIDTEEFTEIQGQAFSGASLLESLDFTGNQIDSIDETAFNGLSRLQTLVLDQNAIRVLPERIFSSLVNLETLSFSDNNLASLASGLLANSRYVSTIKFARNRIDTIGRNFLNNLNNLGSLNALTNVCVSNSWIIRGETTIETVREGLSPCYEELPPEEDVRRFVIEVRGPLTLKFENGTEILTI